jgi:hypothetical protein
MADYSSIFEAAGKQYNVDPTLLHAQMVIESGGNPDAYNVSSQASGAMQITPPTAKSLGVTDPTDPTQAIFGAAKLMSENLARYGNPDQAVLAYHGGTDQNSWGPKTQAYLKNVTAVYQKLASSQNAPASGGSFLSTFPGGSAPDVAAPAGDFLSAFPSATAATPDGATSAPAAQASTKPAPDQAVTMPGVPDQGSSTPGGAGSVTLHYDNPPADQRIPAVQPIANADQTGVTLPVTPAGSAVASAAPTDFLSAFPSEPTPTSQTPAAPQPASTGLVGSTINGGKNLVLGLNQGLSDLSNGATQLIGHGVNSLLQAVAPNSGVAQYWNNDVQAFDKGVAGQEAQYQAATPGSFAAGAGRVAGNVLPTILTGGTNLLTQFGNAASDTATALGAGNKLVAAANLGGRMAGGAALGGASSAVMPVLNTSNGDYWAQKAGQVGAGTVVGGALPVVGHVLGGAGQLAGLGSNTVSPEVAAMAQQAKDLGIPIRADQLANSKPLNVLSAALDYVPFSGKGASLARQQQAFNTALSQTVGENTPNVGKALDQASARLGREFDSTLKNNVVKADSGFQNDLVRIMSDAHNEMTDAQYGVLGKQVNNILSKVQPGDVIDGDAAYNIKKGLDRLSKSSDTTQAYYAKETRNVLIDALNRSLPDGGAAFAKTRQQWANYRQLDKILPRGAEGNISAARLANVRGVNTPDLNDLANIGAQFLKGRVGDSGTAQRLGVYSLFGTGSYFNPWSAAAGVAAGRAANMAMDSNMLTNAMIGSSLRRAALNGGNAALAGQSAPNALLNRFAPYLIPAAGMSATHATAP